MFDFDDEKGVAKTSFMTYDNVFNFACRSKDLMTNEIPLADGEPVRQDAVVYGMKLVFGHIGTKAIDILRLVLDGGVIGHCGHKV